MLTLGLILFTLILCAAALYMLHLGFIFAVCLWGRRPPRYRLSPEKRVDDDDLPEVTVQLPVYNEGELVVRAARAVAGFDYPIHKLQIQILDDSTDHTTACARAVVEELSAKGYRIALHHRPHRHGFKAGALKDGMVHASGEFVALFDADFVPTPSFLRDVLFPGGPFSDPNVGFVQTRWGHLNRDHSMLTRAQAAVIDLHFFVDQPARSQSPLLMNFNGSGGVWRARCIDAAGGWETDTLTEDLDLSLRAQLRGWQGAYLGHVACPGDLPETPAAFARQQFRWARGTMQCVRKLFGKLWAAKHLSLGVRLSAMVHVSSYALHPLIAALILMTVAPVLAHAQGAVPPSLQAVWWACSPVFWIIPSMLLYAGHRAGRPLRKTLLELIPAIWLGMLTLGSNSWAVLLGLFSRQTGVFRRTPKGPPALARGVFRFDTVWPTALLLTYAVFGFALALRSHAHQWSASYGFFVAGLGFALFHRVFPPEPSSTAAGPTPTTQPSGGSAGRAS